MTAQDLLIEVGTEELPPKALPALSEAFSSSLCQQLRDANIPFDQCTPYASPRRLAVLLSALAESAEDQTQDVWGPPAKVAFDKEGKPTRAAEAFAEKNGLDLDALADCVANDGKQDKLFVRKAVAGARSTEVIAEMIRNALDQLPIPKRMRWGASRTEFVRPIHWLSVVYGEQVVDCDVMGFKAGRNTRGHRFHSSGPIAISQASDYAAILEEQGKVIADFDRRRNMIRDQVSQIGEQLGGKAVIDDDLLSEVTALVEWPVALAGNFEQRFLEVPAEALVSSMKEHQKYFHVVDSNGKLMPNFITVANIESRDPQKVVDGNERVIRPRLSDAAFFYETDLKTTLADQRQKLNSIVFQKKLGTLFDKTQRIRNISEMLARKISADVSQATRAAELCKSDLVSEMVGEFDDMQGIAGYYYAKHDGEPDDVASAMQEHYLPRFAGDDLPQSQAGIVVALADRLDTLSGIFGIGQKPTGSKDPFALRRASLAVLRILIEKQLPLDLREVIQFAIAQHSGLSEGPELEETLLSYMLDRLRAWYDDRGISAEVFMSVQAKGITTPLDFDRRIDAVQAFTQLPEAAALAAANKRVSNLLAKADGDVGGDIDASLLTEAAERTLRDALQTQAAKVAPLFAAGDYAAGLKSLAELGGPVDAFFDQVMVNVDDDALRGNRLRLLAALQALFLDVADISQLVPSK